MALLAALLVLVGAFGPAQDAAAQTPSAAQMEAFKNLPPEQQQAILEEMGGGASSGVRRDRDLSTPETVRPRSIEGATGRDATGAADEMELRPREPRIRGNDTVLLEIEIKPLDPAAGRTRQPEETKRLEELRERAQRGNPFRLDANGQLRILGVTPIPLAGLTEAQATERLVRDPVLRDFNVKLTLLPLEKLDAEALRPFGYDLFAGVPSTFAPVTDVPVPSEYVVGPGDRLEVQLIGNTKGRHSLVVNRDGRVNFPELGPIAVSGLRFEEAKARIEARVNEQMIGTTAVVSIGDLRSIRVFVLGEAERPGSYTVSGLATITNALFASGGVRPIGSLRNIQLKRNGRLVQRLDLYDLLLNGDTSADVRLLPGDVIFIPPVGSTVGVTGEIRRPAIYELKGESTAADLLYLGGGLTPAADPALARIERIDERRDRVVVDVNLSRPDGRGTRLKSGDVMTIPGTRPTFSNAVQLGGQVHRPGTHQFRNGLRLTDLIPSIDELRPNADLHYVLIRREQPGTRRIQAFSADLEQAWLAPMSEANPLLAARDQVFVFDVETGRRQYLEPVLEALRLQAVSSEPSRVVRVTGRVRAEGEYPLEPGMTVSDLIRAGGGLAEQAFGGDAELARYEVREGRTRRTEVIKVDLARVLEGDAAADLVLRPFDTLVVKEISEWAQQEFVRLEGEVRFPGQYPIARGETLRSVIARAGGLTSLAFVQGSVFTRETLKERERQQIQVLADRLRQDLSTLALQSAQSGQPGGAGQANETLAVGQTLLADLQAAEPVGRLVIDLERVMAAEPGSPDDVILRGGDRLRIPKRSQEVTVIGEVQNSTSHLFDPALTRDDYLRMSGGTTQKADDKRIYVVRANGSIEAGSGSRWFRQTGQIQPGDTIVVPLDAERMRPLPMWQAITSIIFNLAVAVAAVNSF
jgi:protein involved in polysaccharide export with SLBB domain